MHAWLRHRQAVVRWKVFAHAAAVHHCTHTDCQCVQSLHVPRYYMYSSLHVARVLDLLAS